MPVIQFSSVASEVSCVISADYRCRGWTESSYTAAVRGVVTDASGGAIPGVTVWSLDSGATRNATLSDPYPHGILTPPGLSLGDMTFIGLGVGTITRQTRNPEMYSWNLSIQRDVGWSLMVEINYTGSRGVHLYSPYTSLSPLDPVYWLGPNAQYTRAQLQAAVPNPFYGIITDPKRVNLNGKTIEQYRLLRNMPQYDGVSGSDPNAADSTIDRVPGRSTSPASSGSSSDAARREAFSG